MNNKNFRWLAKDIDSSIVLKVIYNNNGLMEEYAVYNVIDVLEVDGDELEIKTANIDDLSNLLTIGIVRFVNVSDSGDILDIPFRNLYKLYEEGNILGSNMNRGISFSELDCFSIIDGSMNQDYMIYSVLINEISDDLRTVLEIAHNYLNYSMKEKFAALEKITVINHRRLVNDLKDNDSK